MQLPGPPSLVFLAYLFVLLPCAVIRSARRLRPRITPDAHDGGPPAPSRTAIWTSTFASQIVLLAIAYVVGSGFGYEPFALGEVGAREAVATTVAFVATLGIRQIVRALRSDDERRRLVVYRIAPRGPREWVLWSAAVAAAGVAEEVAYRGVAMQILWYSLGDPYVAAVASAVAFALAHAVQGAKSMAAVFVLALVMHALAGFTGSLVPAMAVHVAFDVVAGVLIAREAVRLDRAANAPISV